MDGTQNDNELELCGSNPEIKVTGVKQSKLIKWQTITGRNLSLKYTSKLYAGQEASRLLQRCEKELVYNTGDLAKVKMFGKMIDIPRKQVAHGDPGLSYTFSGNTVPALPWTPLLLEIRDHISKATGYDFNFVLINRYKDGHEYMGEHKDDEKDLCQGYPIASLSLGQARDFIFKHQDCRGAQKRQQMGKKSESNVKLDTWCKREKRKSSEAMNDCNKKEKNEKEIMSVKSEPEICRASKKMQGTFDSKITNTRIDNLEGKMDENKRQPTDDKSIEKMVDVQDKFNSCPSSASEENDKTENIGSQTHKTKVNNTPENKRVISGLGPVTIQLEHGSLLLMEHPTNTFWYHSLPRRMQALGVRINMTFRKMNPAYCKAVCKPSVN